MHVFLRVSTIRSSLIFFFFYYLGSHFQTFLSAKQKETLTLSKPNRPDSEENRASETRPEIASFEAPIGKVLIVRASLFADQSKSIRRISDGHVARNVTLSGFEMAVQGIPT